MHSSTKRLLWMTLSIQVILAALWIYSGFVMEYVYLKLGPGEQSRTLVLNSVEGVFGVVIWKTDSSRPVVSRNSIPIPRATFLYDNKFRGMDLQG